MLINIQPIKFAQHQTSTRSAGLLVSKEAADFSEIATHNGFNITGNVPEGTDARVAFKVDNDWVKLNGNFTVTPLPTQTLSTDSLLSEGNTVAELTAITSVGAFVGKQVFIAVALVAENPAVAKPTFGLSHKVMNSSIQLAKTETSGEYALEGKGKIASITSNFSATGGATASVQVKGTKQDGTVVDFAPFSTFAGQEMRNVQFRASVSVPSVGTGVAKVNSATILYSTGESVLSDVGVSEIVSITEDWHVGVKNCRMTVKHHQGRNSEGVCERDLYSRARRAGYHGSIYVDIRNACCEAVRCGIRGIGG